MRVLALGQAPGNVAGLVLVFAFHAVVQRWQVNSMASHVLRQWQVDCSAGARLQGPEYRLWLPGRTQPDGVSSAPLAPGYAPQAGALGQP